MAGCALTTLEDYRTPFGTFAVDTATISQLRETGMFENMPVKEEIDEHCLEMQLPYLWKRLQETHGEDQTKWPTIVPILVGFGGRQSERKYGELLAEYLKDPENAFIVSSDFCHWGRIYSYRSFFSRDEELVHDIKLWDSSDEPIHESIKKLDDMAIDAIKSGIYDEFRDNIDETGNTVCGRHPIGVMMVALEILRRDDDQPNEGESAADKGKFKFIKYDRSEELLSPHGYSVSYASAYATL